MIALGPSGGKMDQVAVIGRVSAIEKPAGRRRAVS
jgi:hypothetical protein